MAYMLSTYANLIAAVKDNLYEIAISQVFYMPKIDSKVVTTDYILKVIKGEVFRIMESEIKYHKIEKQRWTKTDICAYLQNEVIVGTDLGWPSYTMPDRAFLLNVQYTFRPEHEIFCGIELDDHIVSIPLCVLNKFSFINPGSISVTSKIFKKSKLEKEQQRMKVLEKKGVRKNNRIKYLINSVAKNEHELKMLEKKHHECQYLIDDLMQDHNTGMSSHDNNQSNHRNFNIGTMPGNNLNTKILD
jgi:hypothetical protein